MENFNIDQRSSKSLDADLLTSLANRMADAAAETIMPYFRVPLDVDNKTPDTGFDPVTIADRQAELAIRDVIEKYLPDDGISGEEFGHKAGKSGHTWIVDPIDGTRAFITGVPQWGTLIGLHNGQRSVFGLMDQPFLKERYVGSAKGADLYVGGKHQRTLEVRSCAGLQHAVLMCTTPEIFNPYELSVFELLTHEVKMIRYGGDCYAYCMLASGYIDLVVEAGLQAYDIQPLIPIIEAAGGIVTNWQGDAVVDGGAVIAAGDKRCHEAAIAVLNK